MVQIAGIQNKLRPRMPGIEFRVGEVVETFQQAEFKEWQQHPVTKQLFKYIEEKRDTLKEMWASGDFAAPTMEEAIIRNTAAQGAVSILTEILSLDSDSLSEVKG